MNRAHKTVDLGTFHVGNEGIIATDPCYTRDIAGPTFVAKPGEWRAFARESDEGRWGRRIAAIEIVHVDHRASASDRLAPMPDAVGVDSGQAGFFCALDYPDGETGEYGDPSSFYGQCCAATLSDRKAGIVGSSGAVSSSGYGDGGYALLVDEHRPARRAMIVFIGEDE